MYYLSLLFIKDKWSCVLWNGTHSLSKEQKYGWFKDNFIARFFYLESIFFLAKILNGQRLSFIAICCISYVLWQFI